MTILDQIKENSNVNTIAGSISISESTTSYDIAGTQDFLGSMIDTKYNDSLAYQICDVQPLKGSFGKIFTAKRKSNSADLEVIHKDIETKIFTVHTGFTQEVIQDMNAMFNKSTKKSVQKILKGLSAQDENKSVLTYLYSESDTKAPVTIIDSDNLESVLLQLSKKVSESIIEMNQETYKTLDSFCILSKEWAAAVLGSFDFMTEGREKSLFVGRVGRTDYYINPFPNTASQFNNDFDYAYEIEDTSIPNYCYVGLISNTAGYSSLTFAPYLYESQYIIDPDTGETKLIIRNRYGLVTSPLHKPLENASMIHKFELIKG